MKRVFPDHAYADDRIAKCFWAEEVPGKQLERPGLFQDLTADVTIIGGGFTGLSAAFHLARDGVRVVVLDAKYPGWGASGRNGGFCCLGGSKLGDAKMDKLHGRSARVEWRRAERAAVEFVDQLMLTHGIDADRHSNGETLLAHRPSLADFDGEIARGKENYGVTPQVLAKSDLAGHGLIGPFHGALTTPIGFGLNPRKYLAGLLAAAEDAGAEVFGMAPVTNIAKRGGAWRTETAGGTVTSDIVILATNGYSSEDLPEWMAGRYMPAQSSVIVTRPMSEEELARQGWTSNQMAYDTRSLLHYFRLMPNRQFLFGMRGGLRSSPRSEAAIRRLIRRDFEQMFPGWRNVETPFFWTGMVCLSPALTPFCGPVPGMPGVFAGYAYHGNGVAMGSYSGGLLADLVQNRQSARIFPKVMQTPPKSFPLGRFRRALMVPAYAGFWLRDRFG